MLTGSQIFGKHWNKQELEWSPNKNPTFNFVDKNTKACIYVSEKLIEFSVIVLTYFRF